MTKPSIWTMQVPVVSTAHVPENYRELLPPVCSVIASYTDGDFILLVEEWREKVDDQLLPVLDWFVGAYGTDNWLRLDADGDHVEGLPDYHTETDDNELEFIEAYKTALLWSSGDGEENESFEAFELSPEAHQKCVKDCRWFMAVAKPLLARYVAEIVAHPTSTPWAMAGHDFWLTRAGHGAGFWDRGLGELGDQLSALCGFRKRFDNVEVYLGDDGKVHLS